MPRYSQWRSASCKDSVAVKEGIPNEFTTVAVRPMAGASGRNTHDARHLVESHTVQKLKRELSVLENAVEKEVESTPNLAIPLAGEQENS